MPDRYGDTDDFDTWPEIPPPNLERDFDDRAATLALKAAAITNCGLCDGDGYRGSLVCDHIDYRPIAERGIAAVRAAMGWTGPTTHGRGELDAQGQPDGKATHVSTRQGARNDR